MKNKKITITLAAIVVLLIGMIVSLSTGKKTDDIFAEYGDGYILTSVSKDEESYTIPETYNGKNVIAIGENAFRDYKKLKEVSIPDTVYEIQNGAFYGCSNLKKMQLPTGIAVISDSVFYDCSSLSGIHIPDTVESIEANAFTNCSSLKNVQVPVNAVVDETAFSNCPASIIQKSYTDEDLSSDVEEISTRQFTNMYVVYNESSAKDGIYTKNNTLYITDSELYSEYLGESYELLSFTDIPTFVEYLKKVKDSGIDKVTSFIYTEKGSQEYGKTHFITFNNTIDEIINAYGKQ